MKKIISPVFRCPKTEGITPIYNQDSKILIIGSITSTDGMKKGFYYSSNKNQLWELVDYCLNLDKNDENSFSSLKRKLRLNYEKFNSNLIQKDEFELNKRAIKQEFVNKILAHNLAICDVFESCYFNNNGSLDNDIILNNDDYPFKMNYDILNTILKNSSIKNVIVNSRFVEKQFKKLNIEGNYKISYVISPSPRKGSIDKKIDQWKSVFFNIES